MQEFRNKEIYGDLYENGSRPLVVVLGGSKAGIPSVGKSLSDYLTLNYSVLLLAYFGVGSLPRTSERIPVEYFVNAVNLVREKLRLGGHQVVLIGNSKGGRDCLVAIEASGINRYYRLCSWVLRVPGLAGEILQYSLPEVLLVIERQRSSVCQVQFQQGFDEGREERDLLYNVREIRGETFQERCGDQC
jgi:hypothetical protein